MRRRDFLQSAVLLSALSTADLRAAAAPFDYATLKGRARALAGAPYRPPEKLAPQFLRELTYDQYQAIRFRHDHALWAQSQSAFRLEFFHWAVASRSRSSCTRSWTARRARSATAPTCSTSTAAASIPRLLSATSASRAFACTPPRTGETMSPPSSARATSARVGSDSRQYGLSARGLAIDTALDAEEFPRFTAFWLERPAPRRAHAGVLRAARFAERRPAPIASR